MGKTAIAIIVVSFVLVVSFVFLNDRTSELAIDSSPIVTPTSMESTTHSPAVGKTTVTVTYTNSGYSSASVTIPIGGTIVFKNESSRYVWTASDPHPVHSGYPVSGGCLSSIFDQCKADAPGTSWSFTFDKAGNWRYHNHARAIDSGVIVVK